MPSSMRQLLSPYLFLLCSLVFCLSFSLSEALSTANMAITAPPPLDLLNSPADVIDSCLVNLLAGLEWYPQCSSQPGMRNGQSYDV